MNLVTAKELSDLFRVSDSTIYNLAVSGKIPGFKLGGSWRFDLDEVFRLVHEDGQGGAGKPGKGGGLHEALRAR